MGDRVWIRRASATPTGGFLLSDEKIAKTHAMMKLCRGLFNANVIGTDFDDVQVFEVMRRNFPQQIDVARGCTISFSVSAHAIEKTGDAQTALDVLLPTDAGR